MSGKDCLDEYGNPDSDFYIAANADRTDILVTLPTLPENKLWYLVADTSIDKGDALIADEEIEQLRAQGRYVIPASSLIILMAK